MTVPLIKTRTKQHGFTLLEVMIAIAIFSVISITSFTIFDTVLKSDEASRGKTERLNELQLAFLIMDRDMLQLARRKIRLDGGAAIKGYLHNSEEALPAENQAIGFVRAGWTNPGLMIPRSDLQLVGYRLNEGVFERLHYNFVDNVIGDEPKVRPLIQGVTDMHFEYYDLSKKKWNKELPSNNKIPMAIAIELDTEYFGVVRRQFLTTGEK